MKYYLTLLLVLFFLCKISAQVKEDILQICISEKYARTLINRPNAKSVSSEIKRFNYIPDRVTLILDEILDSKTGLMKRHEVFCSIFEIFRNNGCIFLQPKAPYIPEDIPMPHVTLVKGEGVIIGYTICNCECATIFRTNYSDPKIHYNWYVFKGHEILSPLESIYSEFTTKNEFVCNFGQIAELKNITASQDLIVVFQAVGEYLGYNIPLSGLIHVTIKPQPRLETSTITGNKVDIYPSFINKLFDKWVAVYNGIGFNNTPQIQQDNKVVASNDESKSIQGKKLVFNLTTYNKNKDAEFRVNNVADVTGGGSDKSCFDSFIIKKEILNNPPEYCFNIGKSIELKDTVNKGNLYLCQEDKTVYITTNRGDVVNIENETTPGIFVKFTPASIDIKYTAANQESIVTTSFTPANVPEMTYRITYIDAGGNSHERTIKVIRILNPSYSIPIESIKPQTCNTPPNGSAKIIITGDGWGFDSPSLNTKFNLNNTGQVLNYTGLSAGGHTFSFSKISHFPSGCVYDPLKKSDAIPIGNSVIQTDFDFTGGVNQTLDCVNGNKAVALDFKEKINPSSLAVYVNGATSASNLPLNLPLLTHKVKVKNKETTCTDATEKDITINDPLPLKVDSYNANYRNYKLQISVSNYTGYKYELFDIVAKKVVASIDNITSSSIVSDVVPGIYDAVFTKNNCDAGTNTIKKKDVIVYGKVTINPTSYITVTNCTPQAILPDAKNGSGQYDYLYKGIGDTDFKPFIDKFVVGTYLIKAYDKVTGFYSDEKTVIVGAATPLSIVTQPSVDARCMNEDVSIPITINGGSGNHRYSVNNGDFAELQSNQVMVGSSIYLPFKKISVTIEDATGCRATSGDINVNNPTPVSVTLDPTSVFITKCSEYAHVLLNASGGSNSYTYHYKLEGTEVEISNLNNPIVVLKEAVKVLLYARDTKGCQSGIISQVITSNDIMLKISEASDFRVTKNGGKDATITLIAEKGTTPYKYIWLPFGDEPNISTTWLNTSVFSQPKGDFTFYAKDEKGCTARVSRSILNPFDGLSITPTKENDPQCNGSSSGVLKVSLVADANMKLKELVAKNVTTGVEKSVDLIKSVPPFSFNGLAPGTYSIFVRNTSNTESGANLVSFTEKQDVDISIVNNLPLYHGASTSVTSADVKFKVVENSNSISSVSYRLNEQDTWQQLSKDVDSYYVFKALKGGVYSVKIAKCNSSNTTIKPINVLEIPLPNFDASILHPKDAEEKGTVILSTTETSTDTRYSYSVALINADNDTQVEKKLIDPSQAQVVFDNVIPGNFKVKVYSIYNVDKQTLGDQVIENIKVNLPLKVTVDKDKSLINVCYQSKANFSMLTNLITVDEKVVKAITASGGVGGKPYKYYFVSATNATQRVEMKDGVELDPGTYFVKVVDDKGTEATGANPVEVRMAQPIAIQVLGSIELPCFESVKEIQLVASGGWGNYGVGTLTNDAIPVESREVAGANGVYAVKMGRGNYHFMLTDATGCSGTKAFELMSPLKKLEVAVSDRSKIDLECDGGKSGKVILDVTGGTPFKPETYSYSYSLELATTGVGSNTIENLGAGSYIFYVTDKNGCTQNVRQEIVTSYRPQNLNFEVDKTAATCKNRADGSITLKNPSGMFTYELYRNGSVQNLGFKSSTNGSLEAGAYTVKWINSANAKCSYSQPVLISEPDAISIDNLHIVPGCNGDGKGIILFDLKGGTKPWKVDVDGNTPIMVSSEGRVTFDKLANGSHKVSISDNNTCPLEFSPVVNSLTEDTKMLSAVAHACEGGGSGAAILTPSDSTRSQAWQFFKNVDGEFLQIPYESKYSRFKTVGLAPSTYKAILTDSETKCKIADRVISIHPKIDIVSVTPDRVTCKGGKALVKIDLGKTSDPVTYYYLKKDSNIEVEFTPAADALASGEYTLVVKSDYCAASKQFTVLEPDKALDLSVTPTTIKTVNGVSYHVSCNRGSNGTLSVTPSGGWLDYRLTVDGTPMGLVPEVSRLTGGNHTVRIDDKEGCFVEKGIVLNEPSTPLVLDEVKKWQVKQDGSIADTVILKPTGGFAGYQVGLDALSMKKRVGNDGDEVQLTFTGAGVFRFTASDTLGCEVAKEVMLDQLSQLKYVKQVALPTCFGGNDGKITITEGAESYSYTLKRGSDILTQKGNGVFVGLKSGSYSLKVTDGTFTEYSSVEIRDPERVIISADVDSTCHFISNGVVRVKLVNGTGINRYSLTLTEAGGTTLTNEVQGDLDAQLTELNSGTYTLVATNLNSTCADSDTDKATFHIGRLAALCPTISSVHFCGDEKGKVVGNFNVGQHTFTAELLTRRAATGIWETLSSTVAGGSVNNLAPEVTPGWYRFRTTDRRYGCQELTDSVIVYSSPRISKVEVDNEVCFGQKGTLRVFAEKGSEKLSIFQGQAEFERIFNNTVHLSPGTYKLLVHDDLSGCSQSYPTPVAIDGPAQKFAFSFNPSLYGSYNIDCNGNATGSVAVSLAGGGTLQGAAYGDKTFTSRSFNINQLATGWHRLTATDSFGCTIKDSVELKEPSKLAISIAESSQHLECSSANIGFVRLSAAGGSSGYQFAMNQSAFGVGSSYGNLAVGDYTFRVKDSNGCTDEVKTVIDTRYLPFDIHLDAKNVSCFGAKDGKITAVNDGSQTYTYSWHNSAITSSSVEKLQPGTYGVTIATAAGCTKDLFAQITEPQLLSFTTTAKSACPGEVNGLVNFEANGGTKPYAFLLNDQPFGAIGKDLSAAYGLYLAKVVDANGCTAMQTLNIDKKEGSISANFLVATTSASSDTLVLVDISNPKADYIRWDLSNDGSPIRRINGENDQAPQVKFDREGDYRINMTAYYGDCEYTISKVISVKNGVVSDGTKTFVLGANGIKDFEVYPNPSRGQSKFRIRLFQPYAAVLQVFDMGGHLVSTQDIPQGTENEGVVAFNTKTSGAFIVRVMLKNKKDYREVKVIVQ